MATGAAPPPPARTQPPTLTAPPAPGRAVTWPTHDRTDTRPPNQPASTAGARLGWPLMWVVAGLGRGLGRPLVRVAAGLARDLGRPRLGWRPVWRVVWLALGGGGRSGARVGWRPGWVAPGLAPGIWWPPSGVWLGWSPGLGGRRSGARVGWPRFGWRLVWWPPGLVAAGPGRAWLAPGFGGGRSGARLGWRLVGAAAGLGRGVELIPDAWLRTGCPAGWTAADWAAAGLAAAGRIAGPVGRGLRMLASACAWAVCSARLRLLGPAASARPGCARRPHRVLAAARPLPPPLSAGHLRCEGSVPCRRRNLPRRDVVPRRRVLSHRSVSGASGAVSGR